MRKSNNPEFLHTESLVKEFWQDLSLPEKKEVLKQVSINYLVPSEWLKDAIRGNSEPQIDEVIENCSMTKCCVKFLFKLSIYNVEQ